MTKHCLNIIFCDVAMLFDICPAQPTNQHRKQSLLSQPINRTTAQPINTEAPTTRVPQVRSCPPRGGGVGGFLFVWFLGSKVSWFQSFLAYWCQDFFVSKFESFKDSMIPYYQIAISYFLMDIDLISMIGWNLKI